MICALNEMLIVLKHKLRNLTYVVCALNEMPFWMKHKLRNLTYVICALNKIPFWQKHKQRIFTYMICALNKMKKKHEFFKQGSEAVQFCFIFWQLLCKHILEISYEWRIMVGNQILTTREHRFHNHQCCFQKSSVKIHVVWQNLNKSVQIFNLIPCFLNHGDNLSPLLLLITHF